MQLETNRNHGEGHTYILIHRDLAYQVVNNIDKVSPRKLLFVLTQLFYYSVIEADDDLFRYTLEILVKNKTLYTEHLPDYIYMNSFYPNFIPYNLLRITNEKPIVLMTDIPFDLPTSIYKILRMLFYLRPYTIDEYYITLVTNENYKYLPLTEKQSKMICDLK